MNQPLQKRAGRNIGIEPNRGLPFIQDGGAKEKLVNIPIGSETVILECPEGAARTTYPVGGAQGLIFNTTANDFYYQTFFRDDQGNDCPLLDATLLPAGAVQAFFYDDGRLGETAFCLLEGEQIVLKAVEAPPA